MSLYGLRTSFPDRFNQSQTWFHNESFMDTPVPDGLPENIIVRDAKKPPDSRTAAKLPKAVHLAALFLKHPELPCWEKYLWTKDTDRQGQRVYVGVNNGLFEIHRHLHLTSRWALVEWAA